MADWEQVCARRHHGHGQGCPGKRHVLYPPGFARGRDWPQPVSRAPPCLCTASPFTWKPPSPPGAHAALSSGTWKGQLREGRAQHNAGASQYCPVSLVPASLGFSTQQASVGPREPGAAHTDSTGPEGHRALWGNTSGQPGGNKSTRPSLFAGKNTECWCLGGLSLKYLNDVDLMAKF